MILMKRLFSKCAVLMLLWSVLLPFTSDGATISYQYDNLNRLTKVRYGDGTWITYVYDPAGNRLSRTLSLNNAALKGDINGDDLVNLADAIKGLQIVSGLNPSGIRTDYAASGTDVSGNQKIVAGRGHLYPAGGVGHETIKIRWPKPAETRPSPRRSRPFAALVAHQTSTAYPARICR